MTLRCRRNMSQQWLTDLRYHRDYGLSRERLQLCGKTVPVLHPGPVNRGVEMASDVLDDPSICLVEEQVRNGVPIRMALLYLMAAAESAAEPSLVSSSS